MEKENSITTGKAAPIALWTEWCGKWLKRLAAASRTELTESTIEVYLGFLSRYSPDELRPAFRATIQEWDEPSKFPTVAFILARVKRFDNGSSGAYERFTERVLEAAKNVKLLPSVLDADVKAGMLSRAARLAQGIEQPAQVDVGARIAELRRQAAILGARNPLVEAAGMTEGLV